MPSIKQNHVMPKSSKCHAMRKKPCKTSYSSGPYYIKRLFSSALTGKYTRECAANQKKLAPKKKARQRQQITEAADGGARACTGADGARAEPAARPGAYALLSCADGQLTRAGQHCYSHLACGPLARTSTTTSPSCSAQRCPTQRPGPALRPAKPSGTSRAHVRQQIEAGLPRVQQPSTKPRSGSTPSTGSRRGVQRTTSTPTYRASLLRNAAHACASKTR